MSFVLSGILCGNDDLPNPVNPHVTIKIKKKIGIGKPTWTSGHIPSSYPNAYPTQPRLPTPLVPPT